MFELKEIFAKQFIKALENHGASVYLVGGCVRDYFQKLTPKDIDFIVCNLHYEEICEILEQYGKVDLVGKSFGVIKFAESKTGFDCEIALPRADKKDENSSGHKGIIAETDPFMPLENDLLRRDFTINSIAMNSDGEVIDPFGGLTHLKEGIIEATNLNAFSDDPLRMLRAIQFAARFNFKIETKTFDLIVQHSHLIKDVSAERILIEFEKVFSKNGNINNFVSNLISTRLFKQIFGGGLFHPKYINFYDVKTLSELLFYFICENPAIYNKVEFLQTKLKIDNDTAKQIKAFEKYFSTSISSEYEQNKLCFDVFQICPKIIQFNIVKKPFEEYLSNGFPISYRNLAIDGIQLMRLGYIGVEIGVKQREILDAILKRKIQNNYLLIKDFLQKKA